jgi:hypothetical protein
MHPRAYCGDDNARQLTGPDFSSQGLARLVLTHTVGTLQSSPPDFNSRHFKSAPYAALAYRNGVALRPSFTTDTSAWGGIARCRKLFNLLPGWF